MKPSRDDLVDAQHAINRQKPALSVIPEGQTALFELTSRQAATIAFALGVTTTLAFEETPPARVRIGWAAIIETALAARGGPPLMPRVSEALHRVEASTLERMAALVLAHASAPTVRASTSLQTGQLTIEIGSREAPPDTPETVAGKCIAARAVADAFRERVVEWQREADEVKP